MAEANKVRITAGSLNTTLAPSALSDGEASEVQNCDTSKGIWKISDRQRKWKLKPTRTITSGGVEDHCTAYASGSGVTGSTRSGSTVDFSNPGNARFSDDSYATATSMLPGSKTNVLYAAGLVPGVAVPDEATDVVLTLRIEAQVDPDDGLGTVVIDDYVYFTLSGTPAGSNLATNTPVTTGDGFLEYEATLSDIGATLDDLAGGLIGGMAGWKSIPTDSSAFSSGNWSVGISPSSPQTNLGSGSRTENASYTITATYTGGGSAPTYVVMSVHTSALGYGRGADLGGGLEASTDYSGTASVDDGQGGTNSGPILAPPSETVQESRFVETTKSHKVTVSVGAGTYTVTPVATSSVSGDSQWSGAKTTAAASVVSPSATTLKVDSMMMKVCYTVDTGVTYELDGAGGMGLGAFGGAFETAVVWGQGAFDTDTADALAAADSDWSSQRADRVLETGNWCIWQWGKWLFYAHPTGGVFFRTIGANDWQPLYKDAQSPGSTGDAAASWSTPPYGEYLKLDGGAGDSVSATHDPAPASGGTVNPSINAAGHAKIEIEPITSDGTCEVTINFGVAFDISKAAALVYHISAGEDAVVEDGFHGRADSNFIHIFSGSTDSGELGLVIDPTGLNKREGDYTAWCDLSGAAAGSLAAVSKVVITFATMMFRYGATYVVDSLKAGGLRYHDLAGDFKDDKTTTTADLEYAYFYRETSIAEPAKALTVIPGGSAGGHLGTISYVNGPFLGSIQAITVPTADAPYSTAANIILCRKVGDDWRRIHSSPNTDAMEFLDTLTDSVINPDTTTYPVETLTFGEIDASASGIPMGVTCGCAWKGSAVYGNADGKVYFSRTNAPTEVDWPNVTLTNDPGSDDLGPARTSTLSDDSADYAIALVPAENLYCCTRRAVYVYVAGDTAYTSSFPRKIVGVRGVVGGRAACGYGDRALIGSWDGLWTVKKSSDLDNQPDELIEITKANRGAWRTFLGDSPATAVVREVLGDVWCFNATRFYHVSREGLHVTGSWADGAEVVDASADPQYGLLMQLSSGAMAVIGEFLTDGGTDVGGTNGTLPEWSYVSGRSNLRAVVLRASVWYVGASEPGVKVEIQGNRNTTSLAATSSGEGMTSKAVNRSGTSGDRSDLWASVRISGKAGEEVHAVELDMVPLALPRGR